MRVIDYYRYTSTKEIKFTEVMDELIRVVLLKILCIWSISINFNLVVWQILLGLPNLMYTISTANVGFISYSTQNYQFKILPIVF